MKNVPRNRKDLGRFWKTGCLFQTMERWGKASSYSYLSIFCWVTQNCWFFRSPEKDTEQVEGKEDKELKSAESSGKEQCFWITVRACKTGNCSRAILYSLIHWVLSQHSFSSNSMRKYESSSYFTYSFFWGVGGTLWIMIIPLLTTLRRIKPPLDM